MLLCMQLFLGDFKERFTEKQAGRIVDTFRKALRGVSGDINLRNKGLDMEYTAMLPEKIPNSITI